MTFFNISDTSEFAGVSVILNDGRTFTLGSDHRNYPDLTKHLLTAFTGDKKYDEDLILGLVSPFDGVFKSLFSLSERVSRKGNKLFFDGDPLNNALSKIILDILDEEGPSGDGWKAYVNFLEKLFTNPSKASQDHLFHFLESNKITIHPDGDLIAYKGVQADGTSQHAGPGIVDGVEYKNDHLPNKVGSVVSIPRSQVNDDRNQACSVGLHVGAHTYASTFSQKLLAVRVNPRDVVSVPSDAQNQKVRVSRYEVIAELPDKKEFTKAVLTEEDVKTLTRAEAREIVKEELAKVKLGKVENVTVVNQTITRPVDKIAEFETLIKDLLKADPKIKLSVYKNKRITAGQRNNFKLAATNLGYQA